MRTSIRLVSITLTLTLGIAAPGVAAADFIHTVTSGESLGSIAAVDGLSVEQLAAANGLSPNAGLVTGARLRIPPAAGRDQSIARSGTASGPAAGASTSDGVSAGGYRVAPGDTLSGIAARYGVTVNRLAAANGLRADGLLLAGRRLTIPGAAATSDAPSPSPTGVGAQPTGDTVAPSDVGAVAAAHDVAPSLAEAIADQESGFNNDEVSPTGAVGVMQIEPGTWRYIRSQLGVRLSRDSAYDNVVAGVTLLHSLLSQTRGDARLAAAGYYQGLGSVREHGMYRDTRRYVRDVSALRSRFGGP